MKTKLIVFGLNLTQDEFRKFPSGRGEKTIAQDAGCMNVRSEPKL